MNDTINNDALGNAKKFGKPGLIFISLCVLACKVPLIIAFVSFGGLSAVTSAGSFSPVVQAVGLVTGVGGMTIILGYFIYRAVMKARS